MHASLRCHGILALAALAPSAAAPAQELAAALRRLVDDPDLRGARIGVQVRDLDGDAVLLGHDADRGFMTASNMKLISSAVALVTLGAEFRFVTTVHARGVIRDGVLDGDLVLVGAGDPTLGGRTEPDGPRAVLQRIASELAGTHRVREITGAVLGDDDCQPDEIMGEGWSWAYQAADYAAQVSGLCFAENYLTCELTPIARGITPALHLRPETDYVTVENRVSVGERTAIEAQRVRASNHIVLAGELAEGGGTAVEKVSVENPTAFAATVLRECLRDAGIHVRGGAGDRDDHPSPLAAADVVLVEHRSPPLSAILETLNKVSQNLYAEQLVRAAARQATGKSHMRDAAAHATVVLQELGVDVTGLVIADGSGLTRLNLVQPHQLVELLAAMWRGPHRDLFAATLPIAGIDGTLAKRFPAGHPARGRVRAKTGYISRVVALSGYVPRADRPPLVFSILINNFTCDTDRAKAAVDAFVGELVHHADR